jgi:putative ABC transport system permease protein
MGASSTELTLLLSKGYIKMILIASMIAIPITYFIFSKMIVSMQYYSIEIGVLEIVASFGILLILGLATILSQIIKAARTNPIESLRYE